MGRRKVEIKPIQDKSCRQVAFCKRRKGLLKKAKELSILCDVDVAALIISNSGKLYESSSTNSVTGMLHRYESHVEAEKEISNEIQVAEHSKHSGFRTIGELLQKTERELEQTNADGLPVADLIHLENELQAALIQVRSRKSVHQNEANSKLFSFAQTHLMLESVEALHEKEKQLQEEKKVLEDNVAKININREVNADFTDLCGQQRVTLNFL